MMAKQQDFRAALDDFSEARAKASMQEALARLTGKSYELLSYDEVAETLRLGPRAERGVREIPLKAIVGSVGRYTDFTRTFMPRRDVDRERWTRIKAAIDSEAGLPPIDVYKIGEAYFVLDGNQRVSVARQEGFEFIRAHVIELESDFPLTPETHRDDLIVRAEQADFLERTGLLRLRPGADLSVTAPGQYTKLLEHIEVHRYFMGIDLQQEVSYPQALCHWYDTVYLALVGPIRERGVVRFFPDRTETDLYLWVSEHRAMLDKAWGASISPEIAVADLVRQRGRRGAGEQIGAESPRGPGGSIRSHEVLFRDILVPLKGEAESWKALEQAILIARREGAALHGLHVLVGREGPRSGRARQVQAEFDRMASQADAGEYLKDGLTMVKGSVADQICQHALSADLIVLHAARRWLPGLAEPGFGLRSILWRSPRPILTVHETVSDLDRALLVFDGSPKAHEALYVATYLAERWRTSLGVAVVPAGSRQADSLRDQVRRYLHQHGIRADFATAARPAEDLPELIASRGTNLVLVGCSGGIALTEIVLDEAVMTLLQETVCPLLICR
jgi:nucleotide-binding universal stress UspA family protein